MTAILIFILKVCVCSFYAPENLGWIKLAPIFKDFPATTAIFKARPNPIECGAVLSSSSIKSDRHYRFHDFRDNNYEAI